MLPGPVFLSHSSKDKRIVLEVRDALEARGFTTWVDAHDILGGDALPRKIADGIARSAAMVVFVSHSALESRWLDFELQIAVKRMVEGQLLIVPAVLDDAAPPPEISALLYADFAKKGFETGLKTISTALDQRASDTATLGLEIEEDLDHVFDGRGIISSGGEYRSDSFDFVEVSMRQYGGEVVVPYEVERAWGDPPKPLSSRYWDEYLDAQDRALEPYALLISERPVEFRLPIVEGTLGRLLVYESDARPGRQRAHCTTVFVADFSGVQSAEWRRATLNLVRDYVFERELDVLRARREGKPV